LKAVLFDLGGTLIKNAPVPEILGRILALQGIQKPLAQIASAFKEVEEQLNPEDYMLPYKVFWRLFNGRILIRLDIRTNLEGLADAVTDAWWSNAELELYPDVKETLTELRKKGLKMGIVTNGFQKDIDDILSRTSLTGLFDVTVGVDAVGKPKPDRAIFLYALKKLGVAPQETVFVGDNPTADYEGAKNAGLNPLLIDRDGQRPGRFAKILDLGELSKYL